MTARERALRDLYAGQALSSLVTMRGLLPSRAEMAEESFAMANAMIKERARQDFAEDQREQLEKRAIL